MVWTEEIDVDVPKLGQAPKSNRYAIETPRATCRAVGYGRIALQERSRQWLVGLAVWWWDKQAPEPQPRGPASTRLPGDRHLRASADGPKSGRAGCSNESNNQLKYVRRRNE